MVMLVTFALSLGILAPDTDLSYLQQPPSTPWHGLAILPIIFTSFGFHGSIPSLIAYAGGRRKALRKVFFWGSLIPLLVYLLWLAITLGQIEQNTLAALSQQGDVKGLTNALARVQSSGSLSLWLNIFTNLALLTSFLGVSLGLFDFMHSALSSRSRMLTAMIVYLPPLAIALLLPGAFVIALGYAALAMAVLAILLPAMMVEKLRQQGVLSSRPGGLLFWPVVIFGLAICVLSLNGQQP